MQLPRGFEADVEATTPTTGNLVNLCQELNLPYDSTTVGVSKVVESLCIPPRE